MASNDSGDTADGNVVITRQRKRHVSGDSLKDRRRHSQNLTPLVMPDGDSMLSGLRKMASRQMSQREDVKEESKELFEHFVYDEIQKEKIEIPEDWAAESNISTPIGYENPAWAKYGRELRVMADEFAKTKKRERIKQQASEVDMNSLTYDRFSDMCLELFCPGNSDGLTQERLMVLFFFCSDIAIRSLKQKATNLFRQFLEWSVRFFTERVSVWVEQHGGWASVLGTSGRVIKYVLAVGTGLCVMFMLGKFIMNKYSSSSS